MRKIEKIDIDSAEFPERLRNIPSPPHQIYCSGDLSLLSEASVAVVGSRKYTQYGKTIAEMIGKTLGGSGVPVVSGLAFGIDAFVHEGVVEACGKGIAVLGSGILEMHPVKNYDLMMKLLDGGGLVVSEYEPNFQAKPWTYPARNRIISGLSEIVTVIEANFNSGALITAQHALEQGRTVYAVPGNINSQFSMGSNLLIREGAIPLVVIDDIVRELGREVSLSVACENDLGEDEIAVLNVVRKYNGVTPDKVSEETGIRVGQVSSIATVLEIKGVVVTYSGKIHLAK